MAPLKNLLSFASFTTCVLAAPALIQARQSTAFTLIAIHSTSPIQSQAINAVDGNFYIGVPATTSCPEPAEYCPNGPAGTTVFEGIVSEEGTLGLDVEVPGGQQVYVATEGALKFTPAHSSVVTGTGVTDKFQINAPVDGDDYGSVTTSALGADFLFSACPLADQEDVYQVFAYARDGEAAGCIPFVALSFAYNGVPNFQYD